MGENDRLRKIMDNLFRAAIINYVNDTGKSVSIYMTDMFGGSADFIDYCQML